MAGGAEASLEASLSSSDPLFGPALLLPESAMATRLFSFEWLALRALAARLRTPSIQNPRVML